MEPGIRRSALGRLGQARSPARLLRRRRHLPGRSDQDRPCYRAEQRSTKPAAPMCGHRDEVGAGGLDGREDFLRRRSAEGDAGANAEAFLRQPALDFGEVGPGVQVTEREGIRGDDAGGCPTSNGEGGSITRRRTTSASSGPATCSAKGRMASATSEPSRGTSMRLYMGPSFRGHLALRPEPSFSRATRMPCADSSQSGEFVGLRGRGRPPTPGLAVRHRCLGPGASAPGPAREGRARRRRPGSTSPCGGVATRT
jgi:hypothetical protein